MAPRALHSTTPPSFISVSSLLIFHSYSFSFFPFLPLLSVFYLLFSSASSSDSFLLIQHPRLSLNFFSLLLSQASSSHLPFSLCNSLSLSVGVITLDTNLDCPITCHPHVQVLCIFYTYNSNCNSLCLSLAPTHRSNCQHHPPVAAALFALGFGRISRSPVVSPFSRWPVCGVSLSGLRPRNEEQRETQTQRLG